MRSSRRIKTKKGDKSLIEAESDFAISRCVTSTPVSCITSDENCEISSTNTMKRKANAKLWTNAKKIKNQNMSNNLSSDSTNQRYQPFRVRDNEMNSLRASNNELKLSGFKPIIIHPQFETINSSELQTIDVSDASSEDENVMIVEDSPTNIQQPVIILQRMTSAYVENMINGNVNGPPINYNSWQWQPKVKLTKLTESDLRNVNRSKKVRSWTNQIDPIEFDKDESFIRELSPQTATERFEKRIEEIRKSIQPVPSKPNTMNRKRSRKRRTNVHHLEYEETLKKLQEKAKKSSKNKNNSSSRKLYSPLI